MITRLLVANRGEIVVRVARAAAQLDISTVGVYTHEDRDSLHRLAVDRACEIGSPGMPVGAYLDVDTIVNVAVRTGCDAIHPGYGFLSENASLARACAEVGVKFVGPKPDVLDLAGDKRRSRDAADAAGIAVLRQSRALSSVDEALDCASEIGFPLFVKATAGGGGRGLRQVTDVADLAPAVDAAAREAKAAFGNATVFLEEALGDVRHIEVQLLGDEHGGLVHLLERDCSVQRRYQKIIEIAPARDLDDRVRRALHADALRFGRSVGYENAGTVEFLVDPAGRHAFIEVNPRIQVEHTITEEITDVDIVEAQLRIAGGTTLPELGIEQDSVRPNGFAIQCRVTTEDPSHDFRPGAGRITRYRPASGPGVRVDGNARAGMEVSPHFDSMIEKITIRGSDLDTTFRRARRALAEHRVDGVTTNLGLLRTVLADEEFRKCPVTTSFIDRRPDLVKGQPSANRVDGLARFIAEVTVRRPQGHAPTRLDPRCKLPALPPVPPAGSKQRLGEIGPERFAAELRRQDRLAITDTTLRDAHQSILATRVRTIDLVDGARALAAAAPTLLSLECWGGATYDVALRFLHEDPWDRLVQIREAAPNLCLQMLLRGRNTVGYTPYPDVVTRRFVAEAVRSGIDIFRIFDAFNDVDQMRPAIEAVIAEGAVAQGALCYSGNLASPEEDLYTLDHYLGVAEGLVDAGVHMLCIKDMAGLLRPAAARLLVTALRSRFDLPVQLHTHDTAGGQLATYAAAIASGVDGIDAAAPPLSGMTSQPSLAAVVAMIADETHPAEISLDAIIALEPFWEAVRRLYAPFEAGLRAPTGAVYRHEIPGGQLSNLRQQADAMGLGDRFDEVASLYAASNELLGRPIKVTPSSKVVGDLALHLVSSGTTPEELMADPTAVDLPDSVVGFLHGELGTPVGGLPQALRAAVRQKDTWVPADSTISPEDLLALDDDVRRTLDRLLFPEPARSYLEHRQRYGDLSVLPSPLFWYGFPDDGSEVAVELEPGMRSYLSLESIGEPSASGVRPVSVRVDGEEVRFEIADGAAATSGVDGYERAVPGRQGHVAAPFRGVVVVVVRPGDHVEVGQTVAVIEAMKIEATVTAPVEGRVERVPIIDGREVEAGDLILEIHPSST